MDLLNPFKIFIYRGGQNLNLITNKKKLRGENVTTVRSLKAAIPAKII